MLLSSREKEIVTIMISLFDDEQIIRAYLKDAANIAAYETDRATAERMIKRKNVTGRYCRLCSNIIF